MMPFSRRRFFATTGIAAAALLGASVPKPLKAAVNEPVIHSFGNTWHSKLFSRQLRALLSSGVPLNLDQIVSAHEEQRPISPYAFCLAFEGGLKNQYETALPLLNQYNISATFFVPVNRIGLEGRMDSADILRIMAFGHRVELQAEAPRRLSDYDELSHYPDSEHKLRQLESLARQARPEYQAKFVLMPDGSITDAHANFVAQTIKTKPIISQERVIVPVLMYHDVVDAGSAKWLTTTKRQNEQHMAWLKEQEYVSITFNQLYDWLTAPELTLQKELPEFSFIPIYDDNNYVGISRNVLPIARQYGHIVTLAMNTSVISQEQNGRSYSYTELRDWSKEGIVNVQSHGVTHTDITTLGQSELSFQFSESKRAIEGNIGTRVTGFVCPGGNWSQRALGTARENGLALITVYERGGIKWKFPIDSEAIWRMHMLGEHSQDYFIERMKRYSTPMPE